MLQQIALSWFLRNSAFCTEFKTSYLLSVLDMSGIGSSSCLSFKSALKSALWKQTAQCILCKFVIYLQNLNKDEWKITIIKNTTGFLSVIFDTFEVKYHIFHQGCSIHIVLFIQYLLNLFIYSFFFILSYLIFGYNSLFEDWLHLLNMNA